MLPSTSDCYGTITSNSFITRTSVGHPGLDTALARSLSQGKLKVFGLLMKSLLAKRREYKPVLWSSMVKDTMRRKKPYFNDSYHGLRTFSEVLEEAQDVGLVEPEMNGRSRSYFVTRFCTELHRRVVGSERSNAKHECNRTCLRRGACSSRNTLGASPSGHAPSREPPVNRDPVRAQSQASKEDGTEPRHGIKNHGIVHDDVRFTRRGITP